jgi:predicted DNA-binding transcriptional regulator AlpA
MLVRERLLSVKQTAVRLGVSEHTVRRLIASDDLPSLKALLSADEGQEETD